MLYNVTNAFTKLSETTGTIQNSSSSSIEVSNKKTLGSGVIIKPGERLSFSNTTLYVRGEGKDATVRVVPFILGSGGGGSSYPASDPSDYQGDVDDIWNGDEDEPFDDEFDQVIDGIYGFDTP